MKEEKPKKDKSNSIKRIIKANKYNLIKKIFNLSKLSIIIR